MFIGRFPAHIPLLNLWNSRDTVSGMLIAKTKQTKKAQGGGSRDVGKRGFAESLGCFIGGGATNVRSNPDHFKGPPPESANPPLPESTTLIYIYIYICIIYIYCIIKKKKETGVDMFRPPGPQGSTQAQLSGRFWPFWAAQTEPWGGGVNAESSWRAVGTESHRGCSCRESTHTHTSGG